MTLLPALPANWPSGSVTNARIRGGMSLNVTWADGKLSNASFRVDTTPFVSQRRVEVVYDGEVIANFAAVWSAETLVPYVE